MVIVTAFKRQLCYIQSAPEGYPSTSSNNSIMEYEVCDLYISVSEVGKGLKTNLKVFVKTHLPVIFL